MTGTKSLRDRVLEQLEADMCAELRCSGDSSEAARISSEYRLRVSRVLADDANVEAEARDLGLEVAVSQNDTPARAGSETDLSDTGVEPDVIEDLAEDLTIRFPLAPRDRIDELIFHMCRLELLANDLGATVEFDFDALEEAEGDA